MTIRTVKGRHGEFRYLDNDTYIGRSMQLYGEYGEEEVNLMLSFIGKDSVAVEAGANIGTLTVPLAYRAKMVYAVEPQYELFKMLRSNSPSNVECNCAAFGSASGTTRVPKLDYNADINFGGTSVGADCDGPVVCVLTIDKLKLERCDLIKVDVEGMEAEVLRGAAETIRRCRPVLYVENDRKEKSAELIWMLQGMGYSLYWHLPKLYNPDNFLKNPHDAFYGIVSVNMLCLPNIHTLPPKALHVAGLVRKFNLRPVVGVGDNWAEHYKEIYNAPKADEADFPKQSKDGSSGWLYPWPQPDPKDTKPLVGVDLKPTKGEFFRTLPDHIHLEDVKYASGGAAPPEKQKPKGWVAVCRFGGIGDNAIAASVLGPLKRQGYMVEVITDAKNGAMFENNPYVDKLAVKKDGDLPGDGGLQWQKWFVARSSEYTRMVHLSHTIEGLVAFWPSQTAFYWPQEFRRKLCDRSYLDVVHEIAGVPVEHDHFFFPTDAEWLKAQETKGKIVASVSSPYKVVGWVIKGSRGDKVYPYSPMLIARLIRELRVHVVLFCGVGDDYAAAKQIQEHVQRQNGDDIGLHVAGTGKAEDWPIRRTLTMAMLCDMLIGPDTGVMWSVAMEQMPKVVLLSHASAKNITKHWRNTVTLHADPKRVDCWPCHRLHDEMSTCRPNKENTGAACISDIGIETILNAAREALK